MEMLWNHVVSIQKRLFMADSLKGNFTKKNFSTECRILIWRIQYFKKDSF
jgi:hypothetical protein